MISFLNSFVTWLALEVVVVSTVTLIVTRIVLPFLVLFSDIAEIKKNMRTVVERMLLCESQTFDIAPRSTSVAPAPMYPLPSETPQNTPSLDVCPYLFVSRRVASAFPDLAESMVVRSFHSCYPKNAFRNVVTADTLQARLMSSWVAFVNSLNVCVLFVVNGMMNSLWGYQIISVANWCMVGFLFVIKGNSIHLDGLRGVVFVLLMWASFGFIIKDMLRRMDVILKEQNKLTSMDRRARRKKRIQCSIDTPPPNPSLLLEKTQNLTFGADKDFSQRNTSIMKRWMHDDDNNDDDEDDDDDDDENVRENLNDRFERRSDSESNSSGSSSNDSSDSSSSRSDEVDSEDGSEDTVDGEAGTENKYGEVPAPHKKMDRVYSIL